MFQQKIRSYRPECFDLIGYESHPKIKAPLSNWVMQVIVLLSTDVEPDIAELILEHKLEGGYSLDYALNSLVSYYKGKEIIIFNFKKYFALDNRWSGYKIDDYGTKIVINFK